MAEEDLLSLASGQHGVISGAQARDAGLTQRQIWLRCERARWVPVRSDVFRVAGAPLTWKARLLAECLAAGREALASHRSAARLWELRGMRSDAIEVTVGSNRLGATRRARLHRCKLLVPEDCRRIDSIPVTGPELTLLHLGSQLPIPKIDGLVDDAIRRGLTTLPKLRWRLRVLGRRGRNGAGVLRAVLDARDPESAKAQSALERAFFALVRTSDLPKPRLQHLITTPTGEFLARVDATWPDAMVGVELDGAEFHAPLARWNRDVERQAELQSMGWTIQHFTWWQVRDRPHWVLAKLRSTIRASAQTPDVRTDAQNGGAGDEG